MIIEDDVDIRDAFREILQDEGYQVCVAGNGREALDQLERVPVPNLFLVDLMMPVMDGAEFCEVWRQSPRLNTSPLVMVSASAGTKERSVAIGATGYLMKPVGVSELLELVRRHVGDARAN